MYYFLVVVSIIAADQLSKQWVLNSFQLYEAREIIPGFFNLVYVTNTGAAFSMLAGVDAPWRHYFFLTIGIIAVIGLTVGYFIYRKENPWHLPAFALVAGGAAGNLIDRVRHGAVVDFLDFHVAGYHWPAFNVADSAICVGAGVFILISILESKKQTKRNIT
ncbi:signal peptidase II [Desulfopila sp. IMCC35008]|uniref:signal peptidase II n=1 Tax=Desulfopila sp. IMCC35008 TaxID=2653858 RepID=UPI0013CFF2A9|nr:signal peptidase II [Desulfopila sp. IMCC35008]